MSGQAADIRRAVRGKARTAAPMVAWGAVLAVLCGPAPSLAQTVAQAISAPGAATVTGAAAEPGATAASEAARLPDTDPPQAPVDAAGAKAFAVLEQHCARCHQGGKLDRAAPAGGFGNILRMDQIANDPVLVQPGNPDASRLYTHMVRRLMPFDVYQEQAKGEEPTPDEIQAIRTWISGLKPAPACTDRAPISMAGVTEALVSAGEKAGWDAGRQRFISIAHLYNACLGTAQLDAARHGIVQLLNSLSWKPDAVKVEAVDAARTIYRFDLAELGWVGAHWDRISQSGPLPAGRLAAMPEALQEMYKTAAPIVRADWLARYALKAPLYYDLLALPELGSEVLRILQIESDLARRAGSTQRIGLKQSQFSRGGRLLERTATSRVTLWSAYDAIARDGYRDPADTPPGVWPPSHEAALSHFSLPNGFPAFFLQTHRGQRIDRAPLELPRRSHLSTGGLRAGSDCMACHSRGPLHGVGEATATAPIVAAANGDRTTTRAALGAAGIPPAFALDGVAPITVLVREYEKLVSMRRLAAELMLEPESLSLLIDDRDVGQLIRRIHSGPLPRSEIEAAMPSLLAAVGVSVPDSVRKAPSTREPDAPDPAPVLQLLTDRTTYKSGDALTIIVKTSVDCHLTLISIDQRERATVIFPSDFEPSPLLAAGRTLKLPADGAPYVFRLRERGRETIAAICNPNGAMVDGIKHDFERQRFTDLGNYGAFLTQALVAEQEERRKGARAAPAPEPKARGKGRGRERAEAALAVQRPESIARTAITVEVQ